MVTAATPSITQGPSNMSVEVGATIAMPCSVDDSDAITITWLKDNKPLLDSPTDGPGHKGELRDSRHKMAPSGALQVFNVRLVDAGEYTCVASNNDDNSVRMSAFLTVTGLYVNCTLLTTGNR